MASDNLLGVSSVFLREFQTTFLASSSNSVTAAQICQDIIKPRTQESCCSFMQYMGGGHKTDSRGVNYVATANFRVCFSWQNSFVDLIQVLIEHSEKQLHVCYYWIDLLCENYHSSDLSSKEDTVEAENWLKRTVVKHIQQIGHTLLVFTNLDYPFPVQRSWCVFEVATSIKNNVKLTILSKGDQNQKLIKGLLSQDDSEDSGACFDATFRGFSFTKERMKNSNVEYALVLKGILVKYNMETIGSWILARVKDWIISICKTECDRLLSSKDKKETGYRLATNLAQYLTNFGDLKMGKILLQRALVIGEQIWPPPQLDYPFKLTNLLRLGIIHRDSKDYDSAMDHFVEVLSIYDQLGLDKDDMKRCEALLQQAIVFRLTQQLEDAVETIKNVLLMQEKCDSEIGVYDHLKGRTLAELGHCMFELENYDEAQSIYEKTADLLSSDQKGSQDVLLAEVLAKIGRIYYLKKDFENSLEWYIKSKECINTFGLADDLIGREIQSALNESKFKLKLKIAKQEYARKKRLEKEEKRQRSKLKSKSNQIQETLQSTQTVDASIS